MRIKYTADSYKGTKFQNGAIETVSDDTGHHWIRRGVAVEIAASPAVETASFAVPKTTTAPAERPTKRER